MIAQSSRSVKAHVPGLSKKVVLAVVTIVAAIGISVIAVTLLGSHPTNLNIVAQAPAPLSLLTAQVVNADSGGSLSQSAGVQSSFPGSPALVTQKRGGVEVSLTWVYADADRIAVEYKIAGIVIPKGYQLFCPIKQVTFSDGSTSQTRRAEEFRCVADSTGTFMVTQSFDRGFIKKVAGEKVKATLEVSVGGITTIPRPAIGKATNPPVEIADAGVFHFDLSVPISSGLTLKNPQEVTRQDIRAVLRKVQINPSLTEAEICLQLPSTADWIPEAVLTLGSQEIIGDWHLLNPKDPATYASKNRCYAYSFPVTYDVSATAQQFSIIINQLKTSVPEVLDADMLAKVEQRLQATASGVSFTYQPNDHGFGFEITQKPAGMSDAQAYELISAAFTDQVQGPWRFTVLAP